MSTWSDSATSGIVGSRSVDKGFQHTCYQQCWRWHCKHHNWTPRRGGGAANVRCHENDMQSKEGTGEGKGCLDNLLLLLLLHGSGPSLNTP